MADSLIVDIGGQRLVPCLLLDLKPQHSKKVSKRLPGFVPKLEIGIKHFQLVKAMARLRSPCFRMSQIKKLVFLHPRPPEEAHRLRPQPGQQLILYRSGTRRDSDRTTGGHSPCLSLIHAWGWEPCRVSRTSSIALAGMPQHTSKERGAHHPTIKDLLQAIQSQLHMSRDSAADQQLLSLLQCRTCLSHIRKLCDYVISN